MKEPRTSVGFRRCQWGKPPVFAVCQLLLLWAVSPGVAREGTQTSLKLARPAVVLMQAAPALEGIRPERVSTPREGLLDFHRALAYQVIFIGALCALAGAIAAVLWLVRRIGTVGRHAEAGCRANSELPADLSHESGRSLAALAAQVEQHAGRAPHHSPTRVLVADHNAANRQAAVRMLESLGVMADVSTNGREAVDMVRLLPYDLILMDCQMPLMNGQVAAIEIRKCEPPDHRTPIVAMTAEAGADCLDECLASGMDDILLKPVRRERLMETLHRWLPGGRPEHLPVGDTAGSRA